MRIGQRILDFVRLRENIHGIEADDVQDIFRVAGPHEVVLNIRLNHMLEAVPPIGPVEYLFQGRRPQVKPDLRQQAIDGACGPAQG